MNRNVSRYVLVRRTEGQYGWPIILEPYDKTTGTYFEVFQVDDGKWHWKLYLSGSKHGPPARSGKGYEGEEGAKGSIRSAFRAMKDVVVVSN